MNKEEIASYIKAGEISREIVKYARELIKPKMPLVEIANKIEGKILELGAQPAFPCNLSINEIAAHYTPLPEDETLAQGLLKIDLGVSVQGYISDTAFSLDLENSKDNKEIIKAAETALEQAIKTLKPGIEIREIGKAIHSAITSNKLSPIINLSGHSLDKDQIHAGFTIPNYDNGNSASLKQGAYAVEPFATNGEGRVYEGKPSSIYMLKTKKGIRDQLARKILNFIEKNYKTRPFCTRWLHKEFGSRVSLALSLLEQQGILYQFPQLIEKARGKVAQAEHSFLVTDKIQVIS